MLRFMVSIPSPQRSAETVSFTVTSKTAFEGQIGKKGELHEAGKGIFATENGFHVDGPQRSQVAPPVLTGT